MATLDKFEIVNGGPYKFIGKSMYARAGKSGDLCGAIWGCSDWVFEALDKLQECAADLPHNCALVAWDKYDQKTQLMGYTVGRFMKADTPVPEDMDYIEIPEGNIAKGFIKAANGPGDDSDAAMALTREEIKKQGVYHAATWIWSAEVYPKPDENGESFVGAYIFCKPLTKKELKKRAEEARK